jgi:Skp family chaperone for outer membrane proteins
MKKIIATLALALPLAIFAQEEQTNNDPFAAINNGNKVSQEYIDIAQTTAVLNIQNTERGVGNISSGLVNIKRELIDIEQLTNGLKPNSTEDINAFLKR